MDTETGDSTSAPSSTETYSSTTTSLEGSTEMKGDFSRITFDPERDYSSVLLQQGRVDLDADWNEQGAIVTAALRVLARDLLGPYCGSPNGFRLSLAPDNQSPDLSVGVGWYYVDGIRCANRAPITISGQPGYPFGQADELTANGAAIGYLDVWDRHVTAIEDPSIREVALGGQDTATRTQLTWRVRLLRVDQADVGRRGFRAAQILHRAVPEIGRSSLRARAGSPDTGPRYAGLENQLYRVEIHEGGAAGSATFKWSRDNGSVAASVLEARDGSIRIDPSLLRPGREFGRGDWVEFADDDSELRDEVAPMVRIEAVEGDMLRVSTSAELSVDPAKHPLVRRWDHGAAGSPERGGAVPLVEDQWIDLEQGVQVWFDAGGSYRSGDYWAIPARTATADIEWPRDGGEPTARRPLGVRHHLAPLALLWIKGGRVTRLRDLRRVCGRRGG